MTKQVGSLSEVAKHFMVTDHTVIKIWRDDKGCPELALGAPYNLQAVADWLIKETAVQPATAGGALPVRIGESSEEHGGESLISDLEREKLRLEVAKLLREGKFLSRDKSFWLAVAGFGLLAMKQVEEMISSDESHAEKAGDLDLKNAATRRIRDARSEGVCWVEEQISLKWLGLLFTGRASASAKDIAEARWRISYRFDLKWVLGPSTFEELRVASAERQREIFDTLVLDIDELKGDKRRLNHDMCCELFDFIANACIPIEERYFHETYLEVLDQFNGSALDGWMPRAAAAIIVIEEEVLCGPQSVHVGFLESVARRRAKRMERYFQGLGHVSRTTYAPNAPF